MKSKVFQNRTNQSGAVLPFVAISLLPILMCLAMAVDTFTIYTAKRQQVTNAELAAMAALREYRHSASTLSAQVKAMDVTNNNRFFAQRETSGQVAKIEFGFYNGHDFTQTLAINSNAVKVELNADNASGQSKLFFGKLLGETARIPATGIAYTNSNGGPVMLVK